MTCSTDPEERLDLAFAGYAPTASRLPRESGFTAKLAEARPSRLQPL